MINGQFGVISKCSVLRLGYILIIMSSILAALVHVLAKPILTNPGGFEFNPVSLAACVYIINGLFFTPFTRKSLPINKLGTKNLLFLAVIGISEVIALITYFSGLKESTAVNASIFSNGEIIFSLLITMLVFKENLRKKELGPFMMMMFGMMILPVAYDVYSHGTHMNGLVMGDALIILSGAFYALDVLVCKHVSDKIDAKRITQITSIVSGGTAICAIFVLNLPFTIQITSLAPIAIFAIGGTGIATMLFIISLRLIGGVRTILLFSTNSVLGIIFSHLFLNESITIINMISVGLTFVGVYMLRNKLGNEYQNPKTTELESKPDTNMKNPPEYLYTI